MGAPVAVCILAGALADPAWGAPGGLYCRMRAYPGACHRGSRSRALGVPLAWVLPGDPLGAQGQSWVRGPSSRRVGPRSRGNLDTWVQGLGAEVPGGLRRAPGSLLGASDRDGGLRAVPSWGVLRGLPVAWILEAPQGLHCTWSRGAACRGPRRARWSPRSNHVGWVFSGQAGRAAGCPVWCRAWPGSWPSGSPGAACPGPACAGVASSSGGSVEDPPWGALG